ncbi:hypothetical protein ACLKA7_006221 [Drosophila subpalustris]
MLLLPREYLLRLQLLLIFVCSCNIIVLPGSMGQPALLRRNIIKVRASGFLPFESDLLLPLGILRQLQAQDRASRLLPQQQQQQQQRRRPRPRAKPKPKVKQQVRLERAQADAGVQMYNLIDDDGELLLNLRVHSETSSTNNNHLDALPQASQWEEARATPWRPSNWRPTKRPVQGGVTSSSPRPLPLHQYLSSNSLEQSASQSESTPQSALTQQRRMFGARQDWRSHH